MSDPVNPLFDSPSLPTSDIENTFRMAQVLHWKSDYNSAISRFLLVCDKLERALECDPSSVIDIRYAIFSLAALADIYAHREDWSKSLAFRECEQSFLHYLDENPDTRFEDADDEIMPDFASVATNVYQFLRLFQKIHEAVNLPDRISETPDQTAQRAKATLAAEEKAQTEEVIRLLTEPITRHQTDLTNSFWRRNLERAIDHPFVIAFILGLVIAVTLLLFHRSRSGGAIRQRNQNTRQEALEKIEKAKNLRKMKRRKMVKPLAKEKPEDQAGEDLYGI
jgi:hypothetical protein